jgi:hypothetical protein
MKPEERAEIILWEWLRNKSKIYFNRKNLLSAPVFTTKGVNKKPDLILEINRGYGKEYCAVEVKSSEQSKNIHDARKIMDYYKRYISKKTTFFIDGKEIPISHFLVATENSPKGFLFQDETQILSNETADDNWRKTNAKYKLEPIKEYSLTSMWVRRLWADFRYFRKETKNTDNLPSLGILMSNFAEYDFEPYLFIMNYNSHLNKGWGARWWKL